MTTIETPVVLAGGTKIEWAHFTHNPWWGCTRVSGACRSCYAEALAKRYGHDVWGKTAGRRTLSDANWRKPLTWNRQAAAAGVRYRVFCASMADVFEDHPGLDEQRARLWPLIEATPCLDWMLLTKRPQNILGMVPERWLDAWPAHAWPGTTTEDQGCADERLPELVAVPAAVRFVSYEPAIGPVDLAAAGIDVGRLGLVICGGETGANARPMHPDWARDMRDQCVAAGVAFHFKQWGDWGPGTATERWRVALDRDGFRIDFPPGEYAAHLEEGDAIMQRVGKKAAGRVLDGRTWDEMPQRRGSAA